MLKNRKRKTKETAKNRYSNLKSESTICHIYTRMSVPHQLQDKNLKKKRHKRVKSLGRSCTFCLKRFWAVEILTWETTGLYDNFTTTMVLWLAHRKDGRVARTSFFEIMLGCDIDLRSGAHKFLTSTMGGPNSRRIPKLQLESKNCQN